MAGAASHSKPRARAGHESRRATPVQCAERRGAQCSLGGWCGVGGEAEQNEVGVDLADKHGFQIEFEERLPRDGLAVAQNSKGQTNGHDSSQTAGAAT